MVPFQEMFLKTLLFFQANSGQFSEVCRACLSYYRQQRILTHPVLVHCLEGSGRTAAFVLMAAIMSEIDVASSAGTVGHFGILRECFDVWQPPCPARF